MGSTDESPPPIHTTARLSVDLPTNRVPKQQRRPHQQPQSRKSTNTTDASGGESRLQQFVRKRRQQLLLQKQQQQQQQRSGFVTTTAASEDDSDDMLALPKKRKIEPTNATEVVAHPTLAREDPAGPAFGIVLMTSENAQTADATTEKESQNDDKKQNNCRQSIRDEVEVQEIEPTCLGSLPVLDEFPSHSDHNSDQASTTNHRLENNDDVGELWHCPKCTLLHMMTIRRCTLCGGRRPLSLINDVRAPEASLRRKKKSISSHASKLDRKYVNSSKEHTTPPSSSKNDEHFRNPIVDNTSEYEKTEMKPTSNKELHTLQHSMQTVAPTNEMSSSDSRGDLSSSRMPAVLTQKESMNVFLAPHSDSIHHSSTDSTRCPGNRDIPCELNRKNASCKDSFHEMDRWSNPTRDMVYPFIHPPHDRLDYDQRLEGIMKHILEKMEKCDNLDRFVTGQEHTYEIMNKLRDLETRQQFIMTELHEIRQQNQTILQWHQEMRTSQINWKSDTASNQSNQSLMDQVKAFLEERTILNAKEDGFKQQMATLSEIKVLGAHIMRLETKLDECKLSAVTVHNSTTVSKGFGDRLADVKTTPSHSGIAINNKLLATSEVISTTDEPARVVRPHPTSKARQSKKPISSKTKSTCETSYGTFDVVSLRKSTDQLSEQSAGTFADTTNESTNGRISPSISSGYKKSDVDFSQDCDEAKVNWARLLGAASEHLAGSSFSIRGGNGYSSTSSSPPRSPQAASSPSVPENTRSATDATTGIEKPGKYNAVAPVAVGPLQNATNRGTTAHPRKFWTSNKPSRTFVASLDNTKQKQGNHSAEEIEWLTSRKAKSKTSPKEDTIFFSSTMPDEIWDNKDQPQYPYTETVRCKAIREGLPCRDCESCRKWYQFLKETGHDFSQDPLETSRHRSRFQTTDTPVDFWEMSFVDERGGENVSGSAG